MIKIASTADALFFPIAAVGVTAFVMVIIVIIPQASVDLTNAANRQTSQLEVHSMMSTLFHGSSYTAEDDTPITDYQTISYLICGKNPDSGGWLDLGSQEYIDTGEIELASHYDIEIETPDTCGNNKWNSPGNTYGVDTGEIPNENYEKIIPIMGGETASVTVVYGFD